MASPLLSSYNPAKKLGSAMRLHQSGMLANTRRYLLLEKKNLFSLINSLRRVELSSLKFGLHSLYLTRRYREFPSQPPRVEPMLKLIEEFSLLIIPCLSKVSSSQTIVLVWH